MVGCVFSMYIDTSTTPLHFRKEKSGRFVCRNADAHEIDLFDISSKLGRLFLLFREPR